MSNFSGCAYFCFPETLRSAEKPYININYPGMIQFSWESGGKTPFQVLIGLTRTRLLVERHPYIRYLLFHIIQTLNFRFRKMKSFSRLPRALTVIVVLWTK